MRKRVFFIVFAVLAVVAASLACGNGEEPEVREPEQPAVEESAEEPIEESAEEAEEEPEEEEPAVGTTRGNPALPGSEVTIDNMTFVVEDAVRPADDIVSAGNQLNSPPDEGNEYVMVTLSVTCEKGEDETCNIGPMLNLSVIGSGGVAHDSEWFISGVEGQLESTEFYGGSTVSGKLFFEVGQDETDVVLRYESLFGSKRAFLALPE